MDLNASRAEDILTKLQAAGDIFRKKLPGGREKLINLSRDLIATLELPSETIMRIGCAEPATAVHCRLAMDLKIFEHMKESSEAGVTARDLALKCDADEILISRVMKHLAAMKVVEETDEDTYSLAAFSNALTKPEYQGGIIFHYDVAGPSFRNLPEYLKSKNYKLPEDLDLAKNGPFQAAHKTKDPVYALMSQNPLLIDSFNNHMTAYRAGKPSWLDKGFYPVVDRLVEGFDAGEQGHSDVFLVDVGGGKGHDLRELREKYGQFIPGRLVLQDRPGVIPDSNRNGNRRSMNRDDGKGGGNCFEAMPHDFFMPQPVKGARTYYLHSILHNWSDADCTKILEQLKPAMVPGYSRLLVNEVVVPRRNPSWLATAMDQLMFVLAGVQERTERHWTELLGQAGFRITKIYSYELGQESLIEAELA